jgi:glycosyltransferase involved in cell wall biosynthesis
MRLAVEFRNVRPGSSGGLVYHLQGMLSELARIAPSFDIHFFVTPLGQQLVQQFPEETCHQLPDEAFWRILNRSLKELDVDVLLRTFPSDDELTFPLRRQIVLVPDMQHEYFSEFFDEAVLADRRLHFDRLIRGSGAVVTLSSHSRSTIESKYPHKVLDLFQVSSAAQVTPAALDGTEVEKFSKDKCPYFLYPAKIWPHKNHETLLLAFDKFRRSGQETSLYKLVLTGDPDGFQRLTSSSPSENVVHLGIVSTAELARLYNEAVALVFPSLFEGFGIPVVEAFGFGCPVICSDTTSLPEVAGDAALFCDPADASALAGQMVSLVSNPKLRSTLISAGYKRASIYNWTRSARGMEKAILHVKGRIIAAQDGSLDTRLTEQAIDLNERLDLINRQGRTLDKREGMIATQAKDLEERLALIVRQAKLLDEQARELERRRAAEERLSSILQSRSYGWALRLKAVADKFRRLLGRA